MFIRSYKEELTLESQVCRLESQVYRLDSQVYRLESQVCCEQIFIHMRRRGLASVDVGVDWIIFNSSVKEKQKEELSDKTRQGVRQQQEQPRCNELIRGNVQRQNPN